MGRRCPRSKACGRSSPTSPRRWGDPGWIFWRFVVQTIIGNLHFYVDALLWRFGNPYYRKTLGPLYFKS